MTLLATLAAAGVALHQGADGALEVEGPADAVDAHLSEIREHKAELLALLAEAPPLTADELADVAEAVEERAAIRQYDGGETREQAGHEARSAMRVYRLSIGMPDGGEPRWVTMIAPNCDLAEARRDAVARFGAERVLEVRAHRAEGS